MLMRGILRHPLDVVLTVFETHNADVAMSGKTGAQGMVVELNHFMEKFAFVTETENPGSGGWQLFFWKTVSIVAMGQAAAATSRACSSTPGEQLRAVLCGREMTQFALRQRRR